MYTVYRTSHKTTGEFYYGCCKNIKPSYRGGSHYIRHSVKENGLEHWRRQDLKSFEDKDEAFAFEGLIVDDMLLKDPLCLNQVVGGKLGGLKIGWEMEKKYDPKTMAENARGNTNKRKSVHAYGVDYPTREACRKALKMRGTSLSKLLRDPKNTEVYYISQLTENQQDGDNC